MIPDPMTPRDNGGYARRELLDPIPGEEERCRHAIGG
jgi:hypothetical protein